MIKNKKKQINTKQNKTKKIKLKIKIIYVTIKINIWYNISLYTIDYISIYYRIFLY